MIIIAEKETLTLTRLGQNLVLIEDNFYFLIQLESYNILISLQADQDLIVTNSITGVGSSVINGIVTGVILTPVTRSYLLLETGDYLLLEDGGKIILQRNN